MVADARPHALGLRYPSQTPPNLRQPAIYMFFVRRFNQCLTMAADKGEYLDLLFHLRSLKKGLYINHTLDPDQSSQCFQMSSGTASVSGICLPGKGLRWVTWEVSRYCIRKKC
jgi:hypothetical protein